MRQIDRRLGLLFCGFLLLFSLAFARAQASDVAAGIEAGADTYIIKPFGPIEIVKKA